MISLASDRHGPVPAGGRPRLALPAAAAQGNAGGHGGALAGQRGYEDGEEPTDPHGGPHAGRPDENAEGGEGAEVIRARALALTEYLLAVRALRDRPAQTLPGGDDALWERDLPDHPACQVGPHRAGGGWLRIGRPDLPETPRMPTGLLRQLLGDRDAEPPAPEPLPQDGSPEALQVQFPGWYERAWLPWSQESSAVQAVRNLHDRLYDLRGRVEADTTGLELVVGHLILHAWVGAELVRYPLIGTPVTIEQDPATAAVVVAPLGPPRLQLEALSQVDRDRVAELQELAGPGAQVDLDVWDPGARREFARRAMRRLGLDPALHLAGDEPTGGPHVQDTFVLFARTRQRSSRRFLEALRDRLAEDPEAEVGALAGLLAHEPSRLRVPPGEEAGWRNAAERPLLPLPASPAQESVARRLATHRTVVVQGPPGTGKTHTIRNAICHLVAHGRRVLVVARHEGPLRVLRDGLPAQLQPLCMAVLGRSADNLLRLQVAARELSDRAAMMDVAGQAVRVRELAIELERAEAEHAGALAQLRAFTERECARYPGEDAVTGPPPAASVAQVAEWLRRNSSDGVVPDPVPPGARPPLSAAEFGELIDLCRRTAPVDRAAALEALPAEGQLPAGERLATRLTMLRDCWAALEDLSARGFELSTVRRIGPDQVARLAIRCRSAAGRLAIGEDGWTGRLVRLVRDPDWQAVWDEHVGACVELLGEVARRSTMLAGRHVHVPADRATQPRRLLAQLLELRDRFVAGKGLRWPGPGELARVASDCLLDGEPAAQEADVDLIIAAVELVQLRRELTTRWTDWVARLGVHIRQAGPPPPVPAPDAQCPEFWVSRLLSEAAEALAWDRQHWPALYEALVPVLPDCPTVVDSNTLHRLAIDIDRCTATFHADRIEAERATIADWLRKVTTGPGVAWVLHELAAAWERDDFARWDRALGTLSWLWRIRPDAIRHAVLHGRLARVAPRWAAEFDAGRLPAGGAAAHRAWRWRQAQTWYEQAIGGTDVTALARHLDRCRHHIRRATHDLVVASAWLETTRALDDRRKAALADWAAALCRIGRGTGRSAAHWQAAAQRAVAGAVAAAPVWIMSIDRALEQFQEAAPAFDVVIVDEAAHADLFALPVLALARRCLVVGDDQQGFIDPDNLPADRVSALIGTHLLAAGVPSAEHFDAETSLYEHAVRRSPRRILLTEHFRSVDPIIGFCAEQFYAGRVSPLRADCPAGRGPTIVPVHVPEGRIRQVPGHGDVNVPEAEALISRVTAIVSDPVYANRTIGVIVFPTSGTDNDPGGAGCAAAQASYLRQRLHEALGSAELDRRALLVGDPAAFQGDERDLVLISFVDTGAEAADHTGRDSHRRLNLAVSRARDQLWILHSMPAADLRPDDARAALLAHAARPDEATADLGTADPERHCETDLERAVMRRLVAAGLRPVPRYRVGSSTVDFVLLGPEGRRLAIACDGDRAEGPDALAAALRHQAAAERAGVCAFVRLRDSTFRRDPDAAMAAVWERAESLGIPIPARHASPTDPPAVRPTYRPSAWPAFPASVTPSFTRPTAPTPPPTYPAHTTSPPTTSSPTPVPPASVPPTSVPSSAPTTAPTAYTAAPYGAYATSPYPATYGTDHDERTADLLR